MSRDDDFGVFLLTFGVGKFDSLSECGVKLTNEVKLAAVRCGVEEERELDGVRGARQ